MSPLNKEIAAQRSALRDISNVEMELRKQLEEVKAAYKLSCSLLAENATLNQAIWVAQQQNRGWNKKGGKHTISITTMR